VALTSHLRTVSSPTAAQPIKAGEADWYNEFYRSIQTEIPPWYRALIPDLVHGLTAQTKLLELGCGQGHVLRLLAREGKLPEANIWGIDQSQTAVDLVKQHLPAARLEAGDIYELTLPKQQFDVCLLMETIEHLEHPAPALRNIYEVLAPGGVLYLSFPNYLHLPWLVVRLLAERLNRPNWIVLQPIDKIYTVFAAKRMLREAGFVFERGFGSNFGPPVLYRWEQPWMTRLGNTLGLWWLSFHPVLKFRKPAGK